MHSVSTTQCEQVCFYGVKFWDIIKRMVPTYRGHQLGGHALELLPLLARCLLGLVVWYRSLLPTFDGFSYSKQLCTVGSLNFLSYHALLPPLPSPPSHPCTHPLDPLA